VQAVHQPAVARVALQCGVIKELRVRRKRRVEVLQPQHEQFFEQDLPVGDAGRLAVQVLLSGRLTAMNGERREVLRKAQQGSVDGWRPSPLREEGQGLRHGLWVYLPAVLGDDKVRDLVNKAHGVDLAGPHRALGMPRQIMRLVHLVGKDARRVGVDEDAVATQGKERGVALVPLPGLPRNVEFHSRCALYRHATSSRRLGYAESLAERRWHCSIDRAGRQRGSLFDSLRPAGHNRLI